MIAASMFLSLLWFGPAGSACTLLADTTGRVLTEEGDCASATTPASSFKIPLALMGADAGFVKGAHEPSIAFKDGYEAAVPSHRQATDPARWLSESVVWYSQELTRHLGKARFQAYVDSFGYGNRDLSGDPGKDDGLTRAWLSSSLSISPREQVAFLAKVRQRKLPVSARAYAILDSIVPVVQGPAGWTVRGKTGSGHLRDSASTPVGWYVGWIRKPGAAARLFVRREIGMVPPGAFGGGHARESFVAGLGE